MRIQARAAAWFRAGLVGAGLVLGASACGMHDRDPDSRSAPTVTSTFATTALVSNGSAPAAHTDANLVNAWGLALSPTGFAWVANNGTSTSTLYDGNGVAQAPVLSIPPGSIGQANPTGIVHNSSQDFQVFQNGLSGASTVIFVDEGGTVAGWSPTVNRSAAVTAVDGGAANGALYKGLALARYAGANYLYAADFRNNIIDIYNTGFRRVTLAGDFRDPALPAGYAPFNIEAIDNRIYIAYARQTGSVPDEAAGAGLGIVNVFDTGGTLIRRLVSGGALNAPWGMAMAPDNFGSFSNTLLVANFGDGKINAFNSSSGRQVGTLGKSDGTPIVIDGLWGIAFGNGVNNQPSNTLFFTAGPGLEKNGLYGRIDLR